MSVTLESIATASMVVSAGAASLAVIKVFAEAVLTMIAKNRARRIISKRMENDIELRNALKTIEELEEQPNKSPSDISQKRIDTEKALQIAIDKIAGVLVNELSTRDRRRVEPGLHQSNVKNELRYLETIT